MKKIIYIVISFFMTYNIYSQGFNSVHSSDGINIIAAGDQGKIYRSANSGNSWKIYTLNSSNLKYVYSLSNDVWIAGDNGKVYKTSVTNTPVTIIDLGINFSINSICFINSNSGFLCGDGGRIYKSIDGGYSWYLSNTGIANVKLNSISFKDLQNGVTAGENGNIYITTDGGINWTQEISPVTRNLLKAKYFSDGIGVVGEWGTILIKLNNSVWSQINTRTNSDIKGITGSSINDVHVCGGGGFIRNNKNGNTGFMNFEINPMLANLVDIFYFDSNLGFAVSSLNKVVIKTTNGGTAWSMQTGTNAFYSWIQKTPNGSGIGNNLCMHPTDRNSAYVVYGNKVYVSRDRSETWTQIATISIGTRAHSFYVSPVDTNIWLAAMENTTDCIVRSTNYGANWTNIISADFSTYGQPLEMDQNNPSTFYFAPSNNAGLGFYKSTNSGSSFFLLAPYNNVNINQPCDIVVMWDSSNVIFLGDDGADIWKSTNGGLNWNLVKAGSSSEVPSMCNSVFDKSICYATTWSSSQVFKTVNYGDNWNIVSNNSGSGWGSDLCREDPTVVLTGNYGSQAYLSTNSGANFFNVNTGLSGAGAGIMVPERGYLLNMQTSRLFKMNIAYAVIDSSGTIPPNTSVNVNLKIAIDGYYNPVLNQLNRNDLITVYLHNAVSPFAIIDSAKSIIDSVSLSGLFTFNNISSGTYYLDVRHYNTIQTWSKAGGESLTADGSVYNFDFTNSSAKAYGNNLKEKNKVYCIYSGDVNQDGIIDLSDFEKIDNDVYMILTGYGLVSDLNADDIVDIDDLLIAEDNSNYITVIIP